MANSTRRIRTRVNRSRTVTEQTSTTLLRNSLTGPATVFVGPNIYLPTRLAWTRCTSEPSTVRPEGVGHRLVRHFLATYQCVPDIYRYIGASAVARNGRRKRSRMRQGIAQQGVRVIVIAAMAIAMIGVWGGTQPAQAACGDSPYSVHYNDHVYGGYNFDNAQQKLGVGCYDGNVRWTSVGTRHRGRWFSDGGVWNWSSVGYKDLSSGIQSPAEPLIAGPITVGRWLKVGTKNYGGYGTWWF